jgi:hypothetical protein
VVIKRIITKDIGNLKGISTDSIYLRPPNVAEIATNLQRAPDATTQIRRGYQCQIGQIGGMGIGTFDNPQTGEVQTVCISTDGFAYNKLQRQIFLYYDGQITGTITGISNANPGVVNSTAHGLITGTQVIIRDVGGMTTVNNLTYTITVINSNQYSIGVDTSNLTLFPLYTSGGIWSIAFADNRYLSFSIFTDPRFIYNNAGQSITCDVIAYRAAQINGSPTLTNVLPVQFGHDLNAGDVVQFVTTVGVYSTQNVLSTTTTSITIDGPPVTVANGVYLNQFVDILFGKGFDVMSPFTIAQFISAITDPVTGIKGLKISINGLSNLPAAYIQIVEPAIIDSNTEFTLNYWYWEKIPATKNPPMPGSADITFQNSQDFEIAAMSAFDDVIYITNGIDFPQKYDGQNIYRTGMPEGVRVTNSDNTSFKSKPFTSGDMYQWAMTYEQIDNRGHIIEGVLSDIQKFTIGTTPAAENIVLTNLIPSPTLADQNNWNTDGALAVGGTATVYGPDINGFYYDLVSVQPGFTLVIGDNAYYGDTTAGVITGTGTSFTIPVAAGHAIIVGDFISMFDASNVEMHRLVTEITPTSFTVSGDPQIAYTTTNPNVLVYLTSKVFGNVAIVNGNQSNVNNILVEVNHTVQLGDIVNFIDASNNMQRRNVTFVDTTHVTIDGIPVSVSDLFLIQSEDQRTNAINLQRLNANGATLSDGTGTNISNAISNNLRINIYRTMNNKPFGTEGFLYLVDSIPNDSFAATQTYIDGVPDTELRRKFDNPANLPNPPPISKYVCAFGNQMFYAGGERGVPENSDFVFFSAGNNPDSVSLAVDSFSVPNLDDDITGIGVSGSTLVTTKNNSLWAGTGNFLTGQIEVVQIAKGTNIGCFAHASIQSVGSLMYFGHTNGVYSITENQIFPTDIDGNPIPLSRDIDVVFRETPFLPQYRYQFRRATAINYTKDSQYLLFLPCEDSQSTIRTANSNSLIYCYDYIGKNWYPWTNMNAAGGFVVVNDDLYFQERRTSNVNGNTANLYKQHRFYRLVDHADHAGPQNIEWRSSWADLGQPEVRKKFSRCVLLMDRISDLQQLNNPNMIFSSYLDRIPNLQNTISDVTQVDNIRNALWSFAPWGWNFWSGYQDSFISINLKRGTVAKSIQVGFTMSGINMDIRFAGFQLEAIPENRLTIVR